MKYSLEVVTAPSSEPVTTSELKAHLRLNTSAEDSLLADFITAGRIAFETMTKRAVLPTTFRQWFYTFTAPVYLVRGGVTSVADVKYYDTSDTLQTWSSSNYGTDLTGLVPSVYGLNGYPSVSAKKIPVGYVEFVSGWNDAASVPAPVKLAVKLLAAHYWRNRTAYDEKNLSELPMGFRAVCSQYATGLVSYEVN